MAETAGSGREAGSSRRMAGMAAGAGVCLLMLLLPPPADMPPAAWSVAAVTVLMAAWWVSEAVPVAVTALVPLVLVPGLGVQSVAAVAAPYANPLVFLLLGGLLIGLAMQRCNLHRRIALAILRAAGRRADALVGGFMLATAVLSMWVSNTATAAMMLPIGLSVITLVGSLREPALDRRTLDRLSAAVLLGIAFACNIGGMGTLIGSPPNALFAGYMAEAHGRDIGFLRWMAVGLPVAACLLLLAWLILTRLAFPIAGLRLPGVGVLLARERVELGPAGAAEKRFAVVFVLAGLGWLCRPMIDAALPGVSISDTGIAMAAAIVLFLIPADLSRGRFLLDWESTRGLPWNVILLIGGGLALGSAIETSGLAGWAGGRIAAAADWPLPATAVAVIVTTMLISHVMSNTAAAATLLPLVAALALGIGATPAALAVPAVLAASCAFMLPVATPPNAIVHGSGQVSTAAMVRAGAMVSAAAVLVIAAAAHLLVERVFG